MIRDWGKMERWAKPSDLENLKRISEKHPWDKYLRRKEVACTMCARMVRLNGAGSDVGLFNKLVKKILNEFMEHCQLVVYWASVVHDFDGHVGPDPRSKLSRKEQMKIENRRFKRNIMPYFVRWCEDFDVDEKKLSWFRRLILRSICGIDKKDLRVRDWVYHFVTVEYPKALRIAYDRVYPKCLCVDVDGERL